MLLGDKNLWDGILASTIFILRTIVHTTTQHTHVHLLYSHNSILNIYHNADWQIIKHRNQALKG